MKKTTFTLFLILFVSGVFHFQIIGWGLPNDTHMYTYCYDEYQYLSTLSDMDLKNLDLDPKRHVDTHGPVYFTGAVVMIGNILGLYEIGDEDYYKEHLDQWINVIKFLRIAWAKIPLLLLQLVSFFIGKTLINNRFGLFFAIVIGFLPGFFINSNFAVESIMIVLLTAIVYLLIIMFFTRNNVKYLYWASFIMGLATSIKAPGILCSIFVLSAILMKQKDIDKSVIKLLIISGLLMFTGFALTSPYNVKFMFYKLFLPGSNYVKDISLKEDTLVSIFQFDFPFLLWNTIRITKTFFLQLCGLLFLFIPAGLYYQFKDKRYQISFYYMIGFVGISIFVMYANTYRLLPMVYFLALYGITGFYFTFKNKKNNFVNIALVIFITLSIGIFDFGVIYKFTKYENRVIVSDWIKDNIFDNNRTVTIGLHEDPGPYHPDVLTKEFKEKFHPNSSYYENEFNEVFIFPPENPSKWELDNLPSQIIFPEMHLITEQEKMNWLKEENPEYIVLMHEADDWVSFFNNDTTYDLVKYFPKYNFLGLSNFRIHTLDCSIFKLKDIPSSS